MIIIDVKRSWHLTRTVTKFTFIRNFSDTTTRETKRSSTVHLEKGRKKDEYIYLYNCNAESTSKNLCLVRCSSFGALLKINRRVANALYIVEIVSIRVNATVE